LRSLTSEQIPTRSPKAGWSECTTNWWLALWDQSLRIEDSTLVCLDYISL